MSFVMSYRDLRHVILDIAKECKIIVLYDDSIERLLDLPFRTWIRITDGEDIAQVPVTKIKEYLEEHPSVAILMQQRSGMALSASTKSNGQLIREMKHLDSYHVAKVKWLASMTHGQREFVKTALLDLER